MLSGSMAPMINTGDMVLLKRFERPARTGDVVNISVPTEARSRFGYPPVVIHRIVRIDADGAVTTKGDAQPRADPFTVPVTSLRTRVVAHIPAAGRVTAFLGSGLGLLWLAGGVALFIGLPLLERRRHGLQERQETLATELAALRTERDELRLVTERLPALIERAVANAVATVAPPPAPSRLVAASQWKPSERWDAPPPALALA